MSRYLWAWGRLPAATGGECVYIRASWECSSLIPTAQGKPKPQTTWTHNGSALDNSRVSVRSGEQDTILFIREAQRADSGCYQLCVQLGGLQATATINILVIGKFE